MIVAPYHDFSFLVPKTFHDFVSTVQDVLSSPSSTIVSLSLPLNSVLPIDALEHVSLPIEQHFYWEKQNVHEAIAAGGCLIQHNASGSDRFTKAQQIATQWFSQTAIIGDLTAPFSGPHLFCRFTFFDHNEITAPFPSASVFLPQWHVGRHRHHTVFVANIIAGSTTEIKTQCTHRWKQYQSLDWVSQQNPCAASQAPRSTTVGASSRATAKVSRYSTDDFSDVSPLSPPPLNISSVLPVPPNSDVRPLSTVEKVGLSSRQKVAFEQSVRAVLQSITTQNISKAVLAQVLDVEVASPFQVFPSLQNLRHRYPDCHIFSTTNGKGQVFLGASPERLLRIRNRTLYTEAIAGSAPRGTTLKEDEQLGNTLSCSLKELHEHQLVANFITQQLADLGLASQRSPCPKLLQLTNIQHLHTPIYAPLPPNLSALQVLSRLHPTPAVAGVPRPLACDIIQQQEPFERSLYAAPIGWVNYRGDSEFIVGIRSALLSGSTSRLYAGAGIVRGSHPSREVSEIELKFQTLLTALLF